MGGQNKCRVIEISEGDRILRKKSDEFLKTHEVWQPEEAFVKLYTKQFDKISKEMTVYELGILMTLSKYVSYTTGYLTKTGKDDERHIMNSTDIALCLSLKKDRSSKLLNKFVKLGVMAEIKQGRSKSYCMNPYIFFKGKHINKMLVDAFKSFKEKYYL